MCVFVTFSTTLSATYRWRRCGRITSVGFERCPDWGEGGRGVRSLRFRSENIRSRREMIYLFFRKTSRPVPSVRPDRVHWTVGPAGFPANRLRTAEPRTAVIRARTASVDRTPAAAAVRRRGNCDPEPVY